MVIQIGRRIMRGRYLLFGLMVLCAAGTGTIGSSGELLDYPPVPFLIFGYVWYDGGSPCNNPVVNITNLNTGAVWQADADAPYNYYQAIISDANVSFGDLLRFNVTDEVGYNITNYTVNQDDLNSSGVFGFNLTLMSTAPGILGYAPESPVHDIENATRRFNITTDQVVNITWLLNGSLFHTNIGVTSASCTYTAGIGVRNISARASNENGIAVQKWIWNVTTPPLPKISSFTPSSSVYDIENATRTFSITTDQVMDVTWLINGTIVQIDKSITGASHTNASPAIGIWNVTAVAGNTNGTDLQTWIWHVMPQAPPPAAMFMIHGYSSYANGTACILPFVVVTNLNTSEVIIAENRTGECFYQLVTDSTFVQAGDMLMITASKNGITVGNSTQTVNNTDIGNGGIEVHINKGVPDFVVTNLTFTPEPRLGDLITISAAIENGGSQGGTFVEFYDNKSITLTREVYHQTNDTITLPGILRIRVHFARFDATSGSSITIYNETRLVEGIEGTGTDHWTTWCDGGTIRIESWNAAFTVDRYEALLANESITLGTGDSTNIPAKWDLSLQELGWATNGTHYITARVDPYDQVIESDEANNERTEAIDVDPSLDFAVTDISLNPSEPVLGDVVEVSANITNHGVRNGTTVVGVYYDNRSMEIVRNERKDIRYENESCTFIDTIPLPHGVLGARLHFDSFHVFTGYVDICDNNGRVVERFYGMKSGDAAVSRWTDYIHTDTVTVKIVMPYNPKMATHQCNFIIDRYEALIAEKPVTLGATESKVINASWRTGAAYGGVGGHNITVVVDPYNHTVETNETNNTLIEQVLVNGTDLTVTAIDTSWDNQSDYCYVGQNVSVTATIANLGAADATNFTVNFLDGICSEDSGANTSGSNFKEFYIERLASGESRSISVIWNPLKTLNHTITVSLPYDKYTDNNENNKLFEFVNVEPFCDFVVGNVSVVPQEGVRRGESVNITATIGNSNKAHGGGNVSVAFFVNSTDYAGTSGERFIRIGTIDDVYVGVGETETVSIYWDVAVAEGCHLIAAVANPDEEVEEIKGIIHCGDGILFRGGNNVKNCTLHVNPPNLAITHIALVPAEPNIGDIVDVYATITNNGGMEANSTVCFYMEKEYSQYRVLQPGNVMMRVHLDVKINNSKGCEVTASVNNSEGDNRPVNFYVKCGQYGGQDMEVCRFDGEETECYYTTGSGSYRYWDDVWTEWVSGTAIEINAEGAASVSIDRYQVRLGNETVTLGPGESMVYHGTWNASPPIKAGEYYRGMANVENRTEYSNKAYLGGTDLAVTDMSVKSRVYDGDLVWINATIKNLGSVDATDFIVNFTEVYDPKKDHIRYLRSGGVDHLELINTTHIESLDAGSSINITLVLWNASIRDIECDGKCLRGCDSWSSCSWTEYKCDDYNIRVDINPLENTDKEEDDTNNTINSGVHVDKSRDFKITDLSFQVNNKSRNSSELAVYDDMTLNATLNITNHANQGDRVNVSFYIDDCAEHEIGHTTVTFPAGNGTGYAVIEWYVDIICSHNMSVVIDPEKRIYEINEGNNAYMQSIHVKAPDPEVESLEIHPGNPGRGETVSIDVTISNYGEVDAGNVTLTIYDWAGRHIEDVSEQSGLGREQIKIAESDAAAMRLYLDLEVGNGCRVCVNDSSGKGIVCYHENFHGWTPWVLDNSTTIMVMNNGTDVAYAEVSKIYYLVPSDIINRSTHDLGINVTKKIAVNWTPKVGERLIAAIIVPVDRTTEYNKSNNRLTGFIQVRTADLEVSDLSLIRLNGTEIGENDTVRHGDNVTVTTHISNIGVEDTDSFDVRLLAGDLLIENKTMGNLAPGESMNLSVNWTVTVGNHLLKIEADYGNKLNETNETNNIVARKRHVRGAELSGNTSWETLGLHGKILFEPDQPYDGDEVVITAIVNNSGYVPAKNFSASLFLGHAPSYTYHEPMWTYGGTWKLVNRRYDDAVCIYLNISISNGYPILTIYDGNVTEVKRVDKSCWIQVPGDAVRVDCYLPNNHISSYTIDFYPVYSGNLSKIMELGVGSSVELPPMEQNVIVDDYEVILFIDPENKAPEDEDHREDNVIYKTMHVKPTRDFTVTNMTGDTANLSDPDTQMINTSISNIGLRNGTADLSFVDYEVEHRTYKYHLDTNRSPSYLPVPPDATLSDIRYGDAPFIQDYDDLVMIHRPGVDAIELHFGGINLRPPIVGDARLGVMSVYGENKTKVWGKTSGPDGWQGTGITIPVPGETVYIYKCKASFKLDRYTTETEFHREEVRLNASKTWNESKKITPTLPMHTGDHTITVTLDGDGRTTEINESNNELSSLFHVNASRDPEIVGINITPEHPEDGDDVYITAIVQNNGYEYANFTVDLWANLIRNNDTDEPPPYANLTMDLGGDRIRYITLLKHENLTLAPGNNTTVNATWHGISIAGDPTHHIIAIVDPTDEIDEINESNNEIVRKITPNYPDLTIGTAHVRGGTGEAVVPIKEIGGASGVTSGVTVRFGVYETEKCSKYVHGWDECNISQRRASNMQVFFDPLRAKNGDVIVKDRRSGTIKKYRGVAYAEKWSPWVEGDMVRIISRGAYAEITKYRWGNTSDEQTDPISAGGHNDIGIPWSYECPVRINVTVDPDNNITEIREDNNEERILCYADIRAEGIEFVSPRVDMLCLDAGKFEIDGTITNRGDEDGIIVPVSDFNVTLEFRNRYPNGTIGDPVFNMTKHVEGPLSAAEKLPIRFEFDPGEKFEVGGNYTVFLTADSSNDVCESSELYYQEGEGNNFTFEDVYVYNTSGYTGGGELINIAKGEVNGRVVYTVGDSSYDGLTPPGGVETVRYTEVIPDDAEIEFARIFLYWFMHHRDRSRPGYCFIPEIADVDVTFNGQSLGKAGNYTDTPGASRVDYGYGMYSYDVKDKITSGTNVATVTNNAKWDMGVHAIGLMVVYEDADEPLTKYWVNEGADVVMAANNKYPTGLPSGDCITTATFGDVKRGDTENVNAALLTVMGMYDSYSHEDLFSNPGDTLKFNYQSIGSRNGTGYWGCQTPAKVALTSDEWEYVTEHLKSGDNRAEIHSFGNYLMSNNAFLRLIFPPDLNVINLTAPESTVIGAHHSINVTIRNDGKSDAHDFNVTFHIDGKQMIRIPYLDLPAGENMTLHLYDWTPMQLLHVYNLTAAADVLSGEDWNETETENNSMTKHVVIEEGGFGDQTGPIGRGGGSNPAGGEFTESISGRVLRGIKEFIGGGGGGAGMFSLTEWIMKGTVWLVLSSFVCIGYRMEQRGMGG